MKTINSAIVTLLVILVGVTAAADGNFNDLTAAQILELKMETEKLQSRQSDFSGSRKFTTYGMECIAKLEVHCKGGPSEICMEKAIDPCNALWLLCDREKKSERKKTSGKTADWVSIKITQALAAYDRTAKLDELRTEMEKADKKLQDQINKINDQIGKLWANLKLNWEDHARIYAKLGEIDKRLDEHDRILGDLMRPFDIELRAGFFFSPNFMSWGVGPGFDISFNGEVHVIVGGLLGTDIKGTAGTHFAAVGNISVCYAGEFFMIGLEGVLGSQNPFESLKDVSYSLAGGGPTARLMVPKNKGWYLRPFIAGSFDLIGYNGWEHKTGIVRPEWHFGVAGSVWAGISFL